MKKGKIIIISGPSGSGKTTLYKKLLADREMKNKIIKTVSVTTRDKRPGERHGRDYLFVSRKMFLYKKRNGHFLETEKVFDNYYGTPKKGVVELLKKGKNVLLCIDVKGAKTIARKFPKAETIFIKTPSLAILKKRLKGRGSESREARKIRLQTAIEELKEANNYKYIVINGNLNTAYKQLKGIVNTVLSSETDFK